MAPDNPSKSLEVYDGCSGPGTVKLIKTLKKKIKTS